MPSEHREIRFTIEEVIDAVTVLMVHSGTLPSGGITGLKIIETGGSVAARVSFGAKRDGGSNEMVLPAEHLAAALIAACRTARIPLPKAAEKRLTRQGASLAMHLDL